MRPTRPEAGVTLVELVVAMVVLAIVGSIVIYFIYPVRQAVDVVARAELTDVADNALQRIAREVRLALPNSVRVATAGGAVYLEFLPVVTAGRYRADGGGASAGADCPDTGTITAPASDQLSFGIVDACFKSLGPVLNGTAITTNDFVVLNNHGVGFPNQDAYQSGTTNVRGIVASAVEAGPPARQRIELDAGTFSAVEHDSPGKRFYVVRGNNSTLLPVTYACTASGTLERRSGYPMTQVQAQDFTGATVALLADGVSQCAFEYVANVGPQIGLLTLHLTLARPRSGGESESVTLYQSVHVMNVP